MLDASERSVNSEPLEAESDQAIRDDLASKTSGMLPTYLILVVDDSEVDRYTYRRYLEKPEGFNSQIIEAEDGERAIELCQQACPDLILLDYRLPDMDGLEVFHQLQHHLSARPPIIMLTGEGSEQIAVEALKIGVQDYIIKGNLRPSDLPQTVRRVITQWQLQQSVTRQQSQMRLLANVAVRISQSLNIDQTLNIAVSGMRELLDCDRALVYRFESDMSGTVVAESILPGWTPSQGKKIEDTCFQKKGVSHYIQGQKSIIADIYDSHLSDCHIQLLEQFEVKANLVAPIVLRDLTNAEDVRLWGLLIAHHCQDTHIWRHDELSLIDDLAIQLSVALQQTGLIETLQHRARRLSKVNQRLKCAQKQLEARNSELNQFAYVASHDLKAPLRAIANLADWIQDDLSGQIPEENQQQLQLMQSRVKRMEGFIEGLLEYSRAGRKSLEAVPVNSRDLIDSIVEELAPSQSVTITVPDTLAPIQTQKLLLQQVLSNLIGNAIKYHHRPDGNIQVVVEDLDDFVRFAVTDDGPGIEPHYHERIFDVFQTLNRQDVIESTGIGLSIVKKLVEQLDGEMTLVSEPGKGSTFAFTWPKVSR